VTGVVVICSAAPPDLSRTVLARGGFEMVVVRRADQVPGLDGAFPVAVLVDTRFPGAAAIAKRFRERCPVAAYVGPDAPPSEADLTAAGATATLRAPVGPEWEATLRSLLGTEVRKAPRRSARFPVAVVARGGHGEAVVAQAVDLSGTGMLIDSPIPLDVGEDVLFSFRLPDGQPNVTGGGPIVRRTRAGQFAVSFRKIDEGLTAVRRFVSARLDDASRVASAIEG
jgi:PilZ domain